MNLIWRIIYNESFVNKFMMVGKNDLYENELFLLINIVIVIKIGIKNLKCFLYFLG